MKAFYERNSATARSPMGFGLKPRLKRRFCSFDAVMEPSNVQSDQPILWPAIHSA